MPPRFKIIRFHYLHGPSSLFERVHYKMKARNLKTNAEHLQNRSIERDAPLEKLIYFNPDTWKLLIAEVRTDTGKFVSTAWEVFIDDKMWFVVIGLHDIIKTVYEIKSQKKGSSQSYIKEGKLYQFVEKVNAELMEMDK